jgi:predicted alpha/beta hydrolase family esterase
LYHSEDDPVVPFSALEKIASKVSGSTKRVFKDRKHMNMENFPELVEDVLSVK